MQIESSELKLALIKIKEGINVTLDRVTQDKVRTVLESNIRIIESFLIWISTQEKTGEVNMADLKLGELTKWEPKPRKDSIDESIIEAAKSLRRNYDAIKVRTETVAWTTLANRTYVLRGERKIDDHIVPRKDPDGTHYLVYLDEPRPKRSRK